MCENKTRRKEGGQKQGNGMKKDRKINMFAAIRKMEVRNKIGLFFSLSLSLLDLGIINISLVIFSEKIAAMGRFRSLKVLMIVKNFI